MGTDNDRKAESMSLPPDAGRHVLEMALMMKYLIIVFESPQCVRMSAPFKNRLSLVEVLAFAAASAFHKKLTTSHECGGMLDSEGLDSVS